MPLRVVFMGTPEFSVPTLKAIVGAGHTLVAVYSQPPRPAGRGMTDRKSPVHAAAEAAGIPVHTPRSLRTPEAQAVFTSHSADVAVVVAYGLILPRPILDAPRHGCLNLHASALPRWRGAAPIQRAIMSGDAETAVMVMQMEEGLDTGPVCMSRRIAIGPTATAGDLHDLLSATGAELAVEALSALEHGELRSTPQAAEGIVYASKIDKAEAHIDFTRPAVEVHDLIRGLSPFPGAWFEVTVDGRTERMKVLRTEVISAAQLDRLPGEVIDARLGVACGKGAIRILELQRAGKKPMQAADVLRGFALPPGTRLS